MQVVGGAQMQCCFVEDPGAPVGFGVQGDPVDHPPGPPGMRETEAQYSRGREEAAVAVKLRDKDRVTRKGRVD